MKTICLSHFLSDQTPGFGGQKAFYTKNINLISEGKSSNSQEWTLSNHIGTHIDLPSHFDHEGQRLHEIGDDFWNFQFPFLLNYEAKKNEIIDLANERETIPNDCDFLILKTGFEKYRSDQSYWNENPGLSPDLGDWLRKNRPSLKCIGFDFISITAYQHRELGRKAHRHFLHSDGIGKPICAIEDMRLSKLIALPKQIIVAPILVEGADGAPVTVFAFID